MNDVFDKWQRGVTTTIPCFILHSHNPFTFIIHSSASNICGF